MTQNGIQKDRFWSLGRPGPEMNQNGIQNCKFWSLGRPGSEIIPNDIQNYRFWSQIRVDFGRARPPRNSDLKVGDVNA